MQTWQAENWGRYQNWIFIMLTAILGAVSILYVYMTKLHYPPIRSDGVGYYLYLPAIFIDLDVTFKETARRSFNGHIPDWTGAQWLAATDSYLNRYLFGEAILLSPFFFVGHILASLFNSEMNGFSTPYQYSAAFAGFTYMLVGIYYLQKMLGPIFSRSTVLMTLLCMTFGTNLFHYGSLDSIFSHIFSFFLFVCFLYYTEKWYSAPGVALTITLSIISGLIILVRPTNSFIFSYFIFYDIHDKSSIKQRIKLYIDHIYLVGMAFMLCGLTLIPQLIYWKLTTDHWIIFSYLGNTFYFLHPKIFNVLFSVRKGLFFWSPILFISSIGFIFIKKFKPAFTVPTILFMPINLYVISSWENWSYGGSFGHRAFTESIPIFALGYASLFESITNPTVNLSIIGLSIALILYTTSLMFKYWIGIIPFDGTTWEVFTNTLLQFTH